MKQGIINKHIAKNDKFKFTAISSGKEKTFEVIEVIKRGPGVENFHFSINAKNLKNGLHVNFNLQNLIGVGAVYIN